MTIRDLESKYPSISPSRADEFLSDIRAAAGDKDVDKVLLRAFLERILGVFSAEGKRICAEGERMSQKDREALTLHGRVIAALLLVLHKMRAGQALKEYTLLFLQYASAAVKKYNFFSTALDVICYKITKPGPDWHNVLEIASLDLLSYKLIEGITFDRSVSEVFSFSGKGRVECRDGVLSVCSSGALESGSLAFSFCGDRGNVYTRNVRDERLKGTDQYNASALRSFADTFISVQEDASRRREKVEYHDGDGVDIRLLPYRKGSNSIECEVVDPDTEIKGTLIDEELVKGLWTADLNYYLKDNACIRGAVLYMDHEGNEFSIKDSYAAFAKAKADRAVVDRSCFRAEVYNVSEDVGRVNWMTPMGFAGITLLEETPGVKVGDRLILQVKNVISGRGSTYINLRRPVGDVDRFIEYPSAEDEDGELSDFLTSYKAIMDQRSGDNGDQSEKGEEYLGILSSILANTHSRGSSIDSYRHLLAAAFLAEVIDDREAVERIRLSATYLGECLAFAQGDRLSGALDAPLPEGDRTVLTLLSQWNAPDEGALGRFLGHDSGSLPGKVAALMAGVLISSEFQDEVKADREAVRRKICSLLGVGDSYEAEGGPRSGKYGRVERHDVEFKSSYVFRNDSKEKKADIAYQGKGQVFEAVCAFLNADGGVLYLGVNDGGDPIVSEEYGLKADMEWLQQNYRTINQIRYGQLGHPVPKADTLDHYVLFLNAEKELYFRESLQGNIIIEATEDGDAIRITVSPSRYEIAYLYSDRTRSDGVAFVRDGGRTMPMSRVQKEQRLANLKRLSKEMGFVVTIQEAIDRRQKLIFRNYASSNSGRVTDRYVVPVNLFYNHENVYCYDLDSHMYKQFRLHRIESIEPSEDTQPYPLEAVRPKTADVFRWLDEGKSYHIRLRMDVGAVNTLLEDYSCAEDLPAEEFYKESEDKWILDTRLFGLDAVRRFYMGLADKIEILDSEDADSLRKVIADYAKKNF